MQTTTTTMRKPAQPGVGKKQIWLSEDDTVVELAAALSVQEETASGASGDEGEAEAAGEAAAQSSAPAADAVAAIVTSPREPHDLYSCEMLVALFRSLCTQLPDGRTPVVGMVGYPNVGKSSTINAISQKKLVSVSITPGKTKHFQTLHFDDFVLSDCSGLVFPSYASTKSEMVCNDVLPVDQIRDFLGPATHIC